MAATPRLPESDRREWLLERLSELVARGGWETFVLAPLIEPSEAFFPDRYQHGAQGVRTVVRRLLRHAGAADLGVVVDDQTPPEDERNEQLLPETVIHLVDVDAGTIELELESLAAPEDVVLVLSHLAARAVRRHRRLDRVIDHPYRGAVTPDDESDEDEELEAALASIFEVYLGFGVLAANGAHRYRAAGRTLGRSVETAWVHDRSGGLEAPDVCFLLAIQLVVRGVTAPVIARTCGLLLANQAGDLGAWVEALRSERDALRARLGIPSPETWREPREPDVAPLATEDASSRSETRAARPRALRNEGRPTFRVRRTRADRGLILGGLAGGAVSIFAQLVVSVGVVPALALVGAGAAAGLMLGSRSRSDFCSDPRCERALSADEKTCPGCGGLVSGEIASASERLAAEEALEESGDGSEEALEDDEPLHEDDG